VAYDLHLRRVTASQPARSYFRNHYGHVWTRERNLHRCTLTNPAGRASRPVILPGDGSGSGGQWLSQRPQCGSHRLPRAKLAGKSAQRGDGDVTIDTTDTMAITTTDSNR